MAPEPAARSGLAPSGVDAYVESHQRKDLLRFLTCGSVDDGKSTLIGRLLHDSQLIYEDVLASLEADSATQGSAGGHVDLALLMDGLRAEREQGITIDVAYRYFSTERRTFIIADTPGHPQYTRNMATGASTCNLAIILVDARHGVLPQTKRHSYIASLLGIRQVVVAINKMDLVGWSHERFAETCEYYRSFAKALDFGEPYFLPISALLGDNVVNESHNLDWFDGPPLLEYLETADIGSSVDLEHFRMPVQLVSRPDADFRGYAGTVTSGLIRPGEEIVALPSGLSSTVERIVTFDGELDAAGPGRAVTLTLTDEIDISRGDLFVTPGDEPQRAHELDAMVVWMTEAEMEPGSTYLLQTTNAVSNCTVRSLRYRVDVDTGMHEQALGLGPQRHRALRHRLGPRAGIRPLRQQPCDRVVRAGGSSLQCDHRSGHDHRRGVGLGPRTRRCARAAKIGDQRRRAGHPVRSAAVHHPADRAHSRRQIHPGYGSRARAV